MVMWTASAQQEECKLAAKPWRIARSRSSSRSRSRRSCSSAGLRCSRRGGLKAPWVARTGDTLAWLLHRRTAPKRTGPASGRAPRLEGVCARLLHPFQISSCTAGADQIVETVVIGLELVIGERPVPRGDAFLED